ncbi:uncharacterized protein LOC131890913 [Tigriopus californicus]|uniref:uncharacterized protein LOC131890913 n=1 Tax=Tigriopus californicus TaxID=6832 RepID=UPI0027DA34FB|nr:uncharacterized protein LOC131890913 [Tigriopus californicus]
MELVWMVMLLSFILVGSFHTGHTLGQNGTRAQSSRSPSRRAELPVELQKYAEIHFSHLSAKDLGQTEMDNDNDVEHWRKNLEKRQSWRKNKTSILETIFMKAKVALLKKQEHEEAETNTSNATQPRHRFSNGSCFHDGQIHKNGSQIIGEYPCKICHCYEGSILCFVQECQGSPRKDCTPLFLPGTCCPTYSCTSSQSLLGHA